MSERLDIQSAKERQESASKIVRPDPVDQQKQYESHWARAISSWTKDAHSDSPFVISYLGLLSSETIAEWSKNLESSGYKVEVTEQSMTISVVS